MHVIEIVKGISSHALIKSRRKREKQLTAQCEFIAPMVPFDVQPNLVNAFCCCWFGSNSLFHANCIASFESKHFGFAEEENGKIIKKKIVGQLYHHPFTC